MPVSFTIRSRPIPSGGKTYGQLLEVMGYLNAGPCGPFPARTLLCSGITHCRDTPFDEPGSLFVFEFSYNGETWDSMYVGDDWMVYEWPGEPIGGRNRMPCASYDPLPPAEALFDGATIESKVYPEKGPPPGFSAESIAVAKG